MKKMLIKIFADTYVFFSLVYMMATYSKTQIDYLYDSGMLGINEGRILRKIFRK